MERIEEIMNKFKEKKILVIGDIMLDTYIKGDVKRISPEAPVPIVNVKQEYNALGGAGNVAANVISLGGKVTLFSFVGEDSFGAVVRELIEKIGIEGYLDKTSKTIQKTRIYSENQQLIRFDREIIKRRHFNQKMKEILVKKAKEADMIIISDYAKGTINKDLMETLSEFKNKMIVDPKPVNKRLYEKVFIITPNEDEIIKMTSIRNVDKASNKLKQDLKTSVLLTRGSKGMSLFSDKKIDIPTNAKEVFNVTGAGDTVIAALALALSSGASINEAANIANHAAGITVEKAGTYSVSFSELMSRLQKEEGKISDEKKLKKIVEDLKKKNKRIVWTNGCFDLLHIGHTRYLKEAKKLGDCLIVGLNSDESVRKLKGNSRPIQSERERAEILSSLEFIDHIIIFPELSPERYLKELQPDVYVKGGNILWKN